MSIGNRFPSEVNLNSSLPGSDLSEKFQVPTLDFKTSGSLDSCMILEDHDNLLLLGPRIPSFSTYHHLLVARIRCMTVWSFYKPCNVDTDLAPGSDFSRLIESTIPRKGVHHIGRLDRDTSGLILLSTDGSFTHALLSSQSLRKTYLARVSKEPTADQLAQLCAGVLLGDGLATAVSAEIVPETDMCTGPLFLSVNYQQVESRNFFVRLVTCEGRSRIVRRMLASVGLPVLALHRERIGLLSLDYRETPGTIRELTAEEISSFS